MYIRGQETALVGGTEDLRFRLAVKPTPPLPRTEINEALLCGRRRELLRSTCVTKYMVPPDHIYNYCRIVPNINLLYIASYVFQKLLMIHAFHTFPLRSVIWHFRQFPIFNLWVNWASVSEPHTWLQRDIFSICAMLYICDRHCTSNIAINISIFHLGLIRGARAYCPDAARREAVGPTHCWSHCPPGPSCELTCLCSSGIAPHV